MQTSAIDANDYLVNLQPDQANTTGSSMLGVLESSALGALNGFTQATNAAAAGRMPYDPSNPNFTGLIQPQGTAANMAPAASPGLTLLVLALLIWAATRKHHGGATA